MPRRNDLLDEPVLSLSNSDYLLLRDVVEGTLITGAPGSGKSSCSGRQLAIGLLSIPGMGGLVLTAKGEEKQNWINYTKACGRQKDLLIFSAESGHVFDPIFYEFSQGRGAGRAMPRTLSRFTRFSSPSASNTAAATTSASGNRWPKSSNGTRSRPWSLRTNPSRSRI